MPDPKFVLTPRQRIPWATLLLGSIAIGVFLQPNLARVLEYDRARIGHGQVWRIITLPLDTLLRIASLLGPPDVRRARGDL